jgi:hypothetical protein
MFLLCSLGLCITSIIVVLSAIGFNPTEDVIVQDLDIDRSKIEHIANNDKDILGFKNINLDQTFFKIVCILNLVPSVAFLIPVSYLLS